jgi:peptide/nickel transport system substrate-binding protein
MRPSLTSRWSAIPLAFFLLAVPIFAACGKSPAPANANTPVTIVPNSVGDFQQNFNPFPVSVFVAPGVIYETLVFVNRVDGSVKPWLAKSYEVSADAKTFTFHLRSGVKWSDGIPFTSDDVVFTLNALKQSPAIDINSLWSNIATVAAPDGATVVVTLQNPYSPFLWYFGGQTWIVPKHQWGSVTGDLSQFTDPNPIGTGPFVLDSFSPQLIKFNRNENYWQPGKPVVKHLNFPAFDSNVSAELQLSQKTLDWVGDYVTDIQKSYVSLDPKHNHYSLYHSDTNGLFPNLTKAPFNDLAVRQAISYAIDRNQISKIGESGYEQVASPTGLMLPDNKDFLAPAYTNLAYQQDGAKAQQTLQSAGYQKDANGFFAKDGKEIAFTIQAPSAYTDWVSDIQIMVTNLKAAGMNAQADFISQDDWQNNLNNGTFDLSMDDTTNGPGPYFPFYSLLDSANTAPVGQVATSNFERWNDPSTDSLLSQFTDTTDLATQKQAMAGLEAIVVEQLPFIPVAISPFWDEYSTSRFTGWPTATNQYAVLAPYAYPDNEVILLNLTPAS